MQKTGSQTQGCPRWMKILLGLSLALNLAIVALVAGALLRPEGAGERQARNPGLGAFGAPYMLALPKDDRRAVFASMRRGSKEQVPSRRMRREMFADVLTTLRATPFDVTALENVVSKQADASVMVQKRAQDAWVEIVAQMDDAERASYADQVEEYLRRGRKRK